MGLQFIFASYNRADTAGNERYKFIRTPYYRSSMAFIVVYDVTDERSFLRIPTWMQEISNHTAQNNVILVANKCTW